MEPINVKKNLPLIGKYGQAFKLVLALNPKTFAYAFLYALMTTLTPYLDFWFLGTVINNLATNKTEQLLLKVLLFVSVIYLSNLLTHFFQKKRDDEERHLQFILDEQVTKRLLTIDYQEFEDPKMRENYQKAAEGTNYNGGLYSFVNDTLNSMFKLLVACLVSGSALVSLYLAKSSPITLLATWANSPWFLVCIITLITSSVSLSYVLFKRAAKAQFELFDEVVDINREFTYFSNTVDDYQNGMTFRLYSATEMYLQRFSDANEKALNVFLRLNQQLIRLTGGAQLVIGVVSALLYALVGLKAFVGAIGIGSVILYAGYLQQLLLVLFEFFSTIGISNTIVDYLQYYYDFLKDESHTKKGSLPVEKRNDGQYEIAFENVSFKYPRTDEWVLKDFSFKLNVGERLSVVGRNGSGKTTFIKLLCRLYEPTKGVITLNGIDLQKYDKTEYQQLLAVVFQDFHLFSFSLAENVATNRQPDLKRVKESLEIAGVSQKITELPQGVETILTKHLSEAGVDLSGGEEQKLAIARAWYKDAPFIVLDEPTSALDPIAEFEVYQRFDELIKAKTAIYISHRMSSARFSQRIIVFEEGQVAQEGNHKQLMLDTNGLYYQLFTAQAKYYIEEKPGDEQLETLFAY